jgi:hypothetical protein
VRGAWAASFVVAAGAASSAHAAPPIAPLNQGHAQRAAIVRAGAARIEVLSPTLVRLEYAPDGAFEDRPTQTVIDRNRPVPRFTHRLKQGVLTVQTGALRLRYRVAGGAFGSGDLAVRMAKHKVVNPDPAHEPAPLGGWRRSLDLASGPVPLHPGVLTRAGWYLLDDTKSALLVPGDPGFAVRQPRTQPYQDLYLFAPGGHPLRALADLRAIGGSAPLLPRKAFGVWFSRYYPYDDAGVRDLVGQFHSQQVPLDTLSLDTDYKAVHDPAGAAVAGAVAGAQGQPYSWNAWEWNSDLFTDPPGLIAWLHGQGVAVALNVHPSIDTNDSRFAAAQATAGGKLTPSDSCRTVQADATGQCDVFDWTDPQQQRAYFDLHTPFEQQGADVWWLDWCCDGSSADAAGLTPDTYINWRYAQRQRDRGSRWPAFQRIGASYQLGFGGDGGTGALAERRQTIQFTGDTCGTWQMLAFEPAFTADEGAIGLPYVSHDIGSFHSTSPAGICDATLSPFTSPRVNSLAPDLYVRWVQLGVVQPLLRLHSDHGKRLPWDYPQPYDGYAAAALRLRESLVPYLYTAAAQARAGGAPMNRALWLDWPRYQPAYAHDNETMLGHDLLTAPVVAPGDPASTAIWFPPGGWTELATGRRFRGPAVATISAPLSELPIFVRDGALITTQAAALTTPSGSARALTLTAYPGSGRSTFYDDAGDGLAYLGRDGSATVGLRQRRTRGRVAITIGAERAFAGRPSRRTWTLAVRGIAHVSAVTVNGRRLARSRWRLDRRTRVVTLALGARRCGRSTRVLFEL